MESFPSIASPPSSSARRLSRFHKIAGSAWPEALFKPTSQHLDNLMWACEEFKDVATLKRCSFTVWLRGQNGSSAVSSLVLMGSV